MDILLWITVGGIADWLSGLFIHKPQRQTILMHIAIGAISAGLFAWAVTPHFIDNAPQRFAFGEPAVLASLLSVLE